MMEYCISEALNFGRKAGIAQNLTAKEVSQIRKQGQGKEQSFLLRKYDEYLKDASKYAMKGDRNMMEYCISEAIKSGRQAGIAQNLTAKEVNNIWKMIGGSSARSLSVIVEAPKRSPVSVLNFDNQPRRRSEESSVTPCATSEEVIVEKTVTLKERLDQRFQEEQDAGRVIKLE